MQFIFTYHRLFVCARDIVNPLDQLSQPLIHFWHWFTLAYASRDYLLWILLCLVNYYGWFTPGLNALCKYQEMKMGTENHPVFRELLGAV